MSIHSHTADASLDYVSAPSESLFQRAWPPAFILTGLGLTGAWVAFLGYTVVHFIVALT